MYNENSVYEGSSMDEHVMEFFGQSSDETPRGHFHKVIALHEAPDVDWKTIALLAPALSKGWYELSRLNRKDRLEFTRDYWLEKLPYQPSFNEFLLRFFANLDDIGVFLTQQKFDDPFEAFMVYSLKEDSGFYRGALPAKEQDLITLQQQFSEAILPVDYKSFLQVHNGFWKTTDCTGITRSWQMRELYESFQEMLAKDEAPKDVNKMVINPHSLIPFYESFGMPFFQCFWSDWYPEEEMGNVYYSDLTKTISLPAGNEASPENMAFPTFLSWLAFYLERID
jgi:hypothetical protein